LSISLEIVKYTSTLAFNMMLDYRRTKNLLLTLAFAGPSGVLADSYKLAYSVPFAPKNTTSVDQSIIYNGTYYLSDRVNGGVHVVNLAGEKQTHLVSGFAGLFTANGTNKYDISGPNGLVVLPNRNELYVGDGAGTVRVVDLFTNEITANISIGVSTRADEMAYDSKTGIVVVTLPNEKPPQVAVISAKDRTVTGKVTFHNASELEQPAFNELSRKFYVSVPSTGTNPGGEIAGLDVSTFQVTDILPLSECVPAGIVFGADQNLFISCSQTQIETYDVAFSQVMDVSTGKIVAKISGVAGSDQVAYDPNSKLYFASAYQNQVGGKKGGAPMPELAVINATSNTIMQTWPTDNKLAHSVAVDAKTNLVVVPLVKSGITVYNLTTASSSSKPLSSSGTASTTSSTAAVHTTNAANHWVPSASLVVGVLALAVPFIGY
jgi:hypothetical protein